MDVYIKGFLIACQGIPTTVWVSLIAIVIGAAFGLLLALCSQTKSRVLQVMAKVYIDVVRGTPMLVQALIMAYGVPWLLQSWGSGFKWANLVIPAIIVCGCNSAAYMSEIIRSGIQAVDKGQTEAAKRLGIRDSYMLRYVILPQAIKNILPAIGNQFIVMLKNTSLASTFFIGELMTSWRTVQTATYKPIPALMIVGVIYIAMTWLLTMLLGKFERRLAASD